MKQILIALVVIILAAGGYYAYMQMSQPSVTAQQPANTAPTTTTPVATSTAPVVGTGEASVIGKSVEGRDITAYRFGNGAKKILFVGGMHGGYEWNTSLVAFQLSDYLKANPTAVPAGVEVTVIPVLNPDGLFKVTGKEGVFTAADVTAAKDVQIAGRYNANKVDLNRNFDCDWKPKGVWQTTPVSGGSAAFSEPESKAMQEFIQTNAPTAVVVWYSSAGGVFSSNCHGGVLPETKTLTDIYATASKYPAHESFDFYATAGDMVNWLAKQNIPAISVLLTNHTDTEWDKNRAGVDALLKHFAQ